LSRKYKIGHIDWNFSPNSELVKSANTVAPRIVGTICTLARNFSDGSVLSNLGMNSMNLSLHTSDVFNILDNNS